MSLHAQGVSAQIQGRNRITSLTDSSYLENRNIKSAGIDDHGDQPRGANQIPHEIKNTAHLALIRTLRKTQVSRVCSPE